MCSRGRSLDQPALSPDGRLVAFAASDGAGRRLVVVPVDPADGPERAVAVDPPPGSFAWTPDGAGLVYTAGTQVCLVPLTGGPARPLAEHAERVNAPAVSPDGARVAYVADDRRVHVVALDGGAPQTVSDTADFAFDPAWSPDSRTLAWHEWDVPDMPWDGGRIATSEGVAHAPENAAVQQPRFAPDGRLGYLCDATGWLNVHVDGAPLLDEPFEHGDPAWGQGQRSWCWSPDGRFIALNRNEDGFGRLVVVDTATGRTRELGKGVHRWLSWQGGTIAAWRSGGRTPTQLVAYDAATGGRRTLAHGPVAGFEPAQVEPQPITWQGDDGATVHGLLYTPPTSAHGGLLVQVHGGPVGQNQVIFDAKTLFWLDRGWTVLVPDFRGSTGHGRAYQQAINGRWGELDVADVAAGIRAQHAQGRRPDRTVVMGGSSGGMTVLLLLALHPGLAAAGVASYPVVDLVGLAKTTHRFEAHTNDRLIGTSRALLKERSPLTHAGRITAPLLVFHGTDDEVVPIAQFHALVDKLIRRRRPVGYIEYEGEGHGFRQPAVVEDQLRRTEAWLGQKLLGFPE